MKKFKRIAIIAAIVCITLGALSAMLVMINVGFDLVKLNNMTFERNTYEIEQNFENIRIVDTECDILLRPSPDGICRLVCSENEKIFTSIAHQDNTLQITRTDIRKWYEHIGLFLWEDSDVILYLPHEQYKNIYLSTQSGNIEVPECFTFDYAELNSVSGDISFESGTDGGILAESTSGDITLKNATNGRIAVTAVSGNILMENMSVDTISATATSGEIYMRSVISKNAATLTTVSGNIELLKCDAESYVLHSTSGNILATLLSPKKFDTKSVSGKVHHSPSIFSGGSCVAETVSGNIRITLSTQ